ncbi:MAG: hypothetical protein KGI83_05180 [Verrucomicrobiota bacterium]|nr:hypothetical protein [Verrucomicrobiota bacterium]
MSHQWTINGVDVASVIASTHPFFTEANGYKPILNPHSRNIEWIKRIHPPYFDGDMQIDLFEFESYDCPWHVFCQFFDKATPHSIRQMEIETVPEYARFILDSLRERILVTVSDDRETAHVAFPVLRHTYRVKNNLLMYLFLQKRPEGRDALFVTWFNQKSGDPPISADVGVFNDAETAAQNLKNQYSILFYHSTAEPGIDIHSEQTPAHVTFLRKIEPSSFDRECRQQSLAHIGMANDVELRLCERPRHSTDEKIQYIWELFNTAHQTVLSQLVSENPIHGRMSIEVIRPHRLVSVQAIPLSSVFNPTIIINTKLWAVTVIDGIREEKLSDLTILGHTAIIIESQNEEDGPCVMKIAHFGNATGGLCPCSGKRGIAEVMSNEIPTVAGRSHGETFLIERILVENMMKAVVRGTQAPFHIVRENCTVWAVKQLASLGIEASTQERTPTKILKTLKLNKDKKKALLNAAMHSADSSARTERAESS